MRIAIISIIREPWGGSEELWAAMALHALKEGHEVFISALGTGSVHPKTQRLLDNKAVLLYRRGYIRPGTPFLPRVLKKLRIAVANRLNNPFREILRQQPDCVFYAGTAYSISQDRLLLKALEGSSAKLFINCQLNAEYGKGYGDPDMGTVNAAYARAAAVFFVSARNLATAQRQLCSAIPNARVVRNPVNLPSAEQLPFPVMDGTLQLAMVGILVTGHKGQDLALDVLRAPQWKERSWHLNIYGAGPDESYLRSLVQFYRLETNVTFWGRVNGIREVWQRNHLLLMPSLLEGMPLAVVEAMICGRPVVATDVGGHTEWIGDGKEGFIAAAATVQSLEKAMEAAWQARAQWPEMGAAAHNKAMSLYDPDAGKTLLEILNRSI
jgi:glycosyltransferase involved in cell wall biosynthesis